MKNFNQFIIGLLSIIFSFSLWAQELPDSEEINVADNLSTTMTPKRYLKRSEPIVKVALVYYGDYYSSFELNRVNDLLKKRFHAATGNLLQMETVIQKILPFKYNIANYPDYKQQYVTDIDRLQRLWYYDNVNAKILSEVHEQMKSELKEIDFLLIVTGAQFEALGFASGRVGVTENPMEIAWGLKDGGRTEYVTDERVVDELLHEIGHTMFLDHASNQCYKPGMTYKESMECCESSPAKNDVMSYCRQRQNVKDEFFYGFEACNLKNIKEKVIPAMLKGGEWNIQNRYKCD